MNIVMNSIHSILVEARRGFIITENLNQGSLDALIEEDRLDRSAKQDSGILRGNRYLNITELPDTLF